MRGEAPIKAETIEYTIAIPVYNQRRFICRAVKSALAQKSAGRLVIVVDNQSDDGTWEELQQFSAPDVLLYRNRTNLGLFGNFNRCLDLARGSFLRFLSGDDALPPGCLESEIALMRAHPTVAMLSGRGRFVTPELVNCGVFANDFPPGIYSGKTFADLWFQYYARYRRNPLNYPSGILFRRSAIEGLRFEPGLKTAGDIDFFFKVLRNGDLAITDAEACEVTRHKGQAHIVSNLDGTAVEEQLVLLDRYVDPRTARNLKKGLAGTCLALALQRVLRRDTRASARIHWKLSRRLATLPAAVAGLALLVACRAAQAMLGRHAPFVPAPERRIS